MARRIFGLTPEMMGFFSAKLNVEYPWPKYDQITGRDYVSGAMENTTATLHTDALQQNARQLADGNRYEDYISHELFHQWFGDLVTCDTLKPGFYRNFEEFVANQPTFTYDNENHLKKLLEVMHYRVNKNISNEAPDTSYWGFCDGKKLFARYEYNFYELEKHDCAYYIAPTLDARRKYFNRQGWNMLIGLTMLTTGIVAKEGITFAGFNTVHKPDTPLVAIPFGGSYATGLLLDMDTGKITF